MNSQRILPTNKASKLIDSKLSSLRHEQDSTAATNSRNLVFPITADEASKVLASYLWEMEKRKIFEYKTIYFFLRQLFSACIFYFTRLQLIINFNFIYTTLKVL